MRVGLNDGEISAEDSGHEYCCCSRKYGRNFGRIPCQWDHGWDLLLFAVPIAYYCCLHVVCPVDSIASTILQLHLPSLQPVPIVPVNLMHPMHASLQRFPGLMHAQRHASSPPRPLDHASVAHWPNRGWRGGNSTHPHNHDTHRSAPNSTK